eukprot:91064-Chlamydomonas_euryale.AAC.1
MLGGETQTEGGWGGGGEGQKVVRAEGKPAGRGNTNSWEGKHKQLGGGTQTAGRGNTNRRRVGRKHKGRAADNLLGP